MQKTKSVLSSATLWGIIIAAISFAAKHYFGAQIVVPDNPDFAQLQQIAQQVKASNGNTMALINTIIGSFGLLFAIWGRVKADTKLTLSNPFKPIPKKITMVIAFLAIASIASAQLIKTNPFAPIQRPRRLTVMAFGDSSVISHSSDRIVTLRFTPMAGYNFTTKQLMAGIGYGPQWTKWVDSLQKWKTTFSLQIVGWVNGNTSPSVNPPNFTSFGISAGVLNQTVIAGVAWTPPTNLTKGTIGIVALIGFAQNN